MTATVFENEIKSFNSVLCCQALFQSNCLKLCFCNLQLYYLILTDISLVQIGFVHLVFPLNTDWLLMLLSLKKVDTFQQTALDSSLQTAFTRTSVSYMKWPDGLSGICDTGLSVSPFTGPRYLSSKVQLRYNKHNTRQIANQLQKFLL